jgi:hypothetical protein
MLAAMVEIVIHSGGQLDVLLCVVEMNMKGLVAVVVGSFGPRFAQ